MERGNIILPEEIKSILNKYYDGEATIEEERHLKEYFRCNSIPFDYSQDSDILAFSDKEYNAILPHEILWSKIKEEDKKNKRKGRAFKIISSAAASILVIFSVSLWYHISQKEINKFTTDTYSDPQEAYRVAQKYLGLVSNKLSYAYVEMKPIEKIDYATGIMQQFRGIDHGFRYLNHLNDFEKSTKNLTQLSVISDYLIVDDK